MGGVGVSAFTSIAIVIIVLIFGISASSRPSKYLSRRRRWWKRVHVKESLLIDKAIQ